MTHGRMTASVLLLGAFLGLASCTPLPEDEATVPTWGLREDWRVGGETSGPHSFDANAGLTMLPGDSLLHFDFQDQRFHVLDLSGNPVRSFGRKGRGPGETSGGNGFAISPTGEIVVNDRDNDRLARFDAAGKFLGSVALRWQYTLGIRWDGEFLEDGRLVDRYTTVADSLGARVFLDRTRLWSRRLATFDDLDLSTCMVSPRPAGEQTSISTFDGADAIYGMLPLPFSGPWLASAIDPAGYIWGLAALQDSLKLSKFPIDRCVAVATITLPDNAPLIPSLVADSAIEALAGFASAIGRSLPADTRLPERYPQFWTLNVDDQHQLWVQRFGPAGERVMEVYDARGAPVARLDRFPLMTSAPLVFHDDHIYGFTTDSDGIKYLVALTVLR